ncbi:MAG: bifunctional precorrin-2 dehydrogenase/sirohydrochlorin ferrochelatase [Methanobacterium sp. ERen5]|nr:MAG: bifunctional precorrin-2 dehydrogenase/sirohydrochlorin ferrochelatase [Methanobacterium sp. ERen5]
MGWTPLYLNMADKKVLIVGSGEVGSRRCERFLDAGAKVVLMGDHVNDDLVQLGAIVKTIDELGLWIDWADIVVAASGDHELNYKVGEMSGDKLINRADNPNDGNLIVPSSFFIGDVQICIFTGGKSPLMSKELRKKIQKVIKPEDIYQLELQYYARNILKQNIDDQKTRREYLYIILEDLKIKELLNKGDLESAKRHASTIIDTINPM